MKTQLVFAIVINDMVLSSRFETIEDAENYITEHKFNDECTIVNIIKSVLPKPKFPQTYDDALDYLVSNDKSIITKKNHAEREKAFSHLMIITDVWNEIDGFVPDFTDGNSYRYIPIIETLTNKVTIISSSLNKNYPFCFRTYEIAKQFGETFKDLLITYLTTQP